ncbi:hypothetical protein GCM10009077_39140 [Roseibium denhamense]
MPGFQRVEQLEGRDLLVDSVCHYSDGFITNAKSSKIDSDGYNSVDIDTESRETGTKRTLTIFEAYWSDLIPDRVQETPLTKFWRATKLLFYWFTGGLARNVFRWPPRFPYQTSIAMICIGIMLVLWYLSVAAMLAAAIASGDTVVADWFTQLAKWVGIPDNWASQLDVILNSAFVVFLIGLFGVGRLQAIADISDFVKNYLRDEPGAASGVGLRAKLRKRVLDLLDHVHSVDEPYDEVFVVAHSIGGIIALDALAEYGSRLEKISFHTWGSAMGALASQEPLVEAEVLKVYDNKTRLKSWTDIVFRGDFMASRIPVPAGRDPIFAPTIYPQMPEGGFMRQQKLHMDYFRCEEAILPLLQEVKVHDMEAAAVQSGEVSGDKPLTA